MTLITPETQVTQTAELLQSLQTSIRALRLQVEDLRQQIQSGGEGKTVTGTRHFAGAETLIRECQKVELCLVEQANRQAGIAKGGYALDLDVARVEVGCRLARLRTCCGSGRVSE